MNLDNLIRDVYGHKARTGTAAVKVLLPLASYKDYLSHVLGAWSSLGCEPQHGEQHFICGVPIEYVHNQPEPWIIL